MPPPLSFRSEARNLVFSLRSDPVEISPCGRDDNRGKVEMTAGVGRDDSGERARFPGVGGFSSSNF